MWLLLDNWTGRKLEDLDVFQYISYIPNILRYANLDELFFQYISYIPNLLRQANFDGLFLCDR